VILIDALAGNDQVYVGPTVQRTVWIDAGDGDDVVKIASGSSILVDRADLNVRNDLPDTAYRVGEPTGLTESLALKGLTLDNPADLDWYRFTLAADASANAQIVAASNSDLDGLNVELYRVNNDGTTAAMPPWSRRTASTRAAETTRGRRPMNSGTSGPSRTSSASAV